MTKAELEHENKMLTMKIDILELKLTREEVWHDLQRAKLQAEIDALLKDRDKGGGSHAIGFHIPPPYEFPNE